MFHFCLVVLYLCCLASVSGSCASLNYCNGHGLCSADSKCNCFEGWGADSDLTNYRAPDCSAKVCPSGTSWGDLALPTGEAHQPAECSDKGVCNRQTGKCQCSAGYEGAACQRLKCPNNCSGHGSSQAWDSLKIVGCLCESSWPVGFGANETQEAEWFGPDCSLRHCPSADNPRTTLNETDCEKPPAALSSNPNRTRGEPGNLCQVDCANQGICNHFTGLCRCFPGMTGPDCATLLEGVPLQFTSPDGIYAAQPLDAFYSDESNYLDGVEWV